METKHWIYEEKQNSKLNAKKKGGFMKCIVETGGSLNALRVMNEFGLNTK